MTSCVQFWQGRVFMASLHWLSRPSLLLLPQQAVTERPSMWQCQSGSRANNPRASWTRAGPVLGWRAPATRFQTLTVDIISAPI